MSAQSNKTEDMSTNEKLFLAQLLLRDIRLDCSCDTKRRAILARDLLLKIKDEYPGVMIEKLISIVNEFLSYPEGVIDGRYFRDHFPYGYYDMDKFHNIRSKRLKGKSKTFKQYVKDYIHYPDMLFEDAKPTGDVVHKEWYFVDSSIWHSVVDDKPPLNVPVLCLVSKKRLNREEDYYLTVLTLKQFGTEDNNLLYWEEEVSGMNPSEWRAEVKLWTWTNCLPSRINDIVKEEPKW